LELLLASCVNLSKCNWKIKKRRCIEFTIYLNVPKNKLEVHVYSTWPPFHTSSFFVSYPRQLFFFPSFLYFDLNFMGWFFHSMHAAGICWHYAKRSRRLRPGKAIWNCLNTATTLFVSKYFSTMNVLSGIVSFGIMNGDCKVLNNDVLNDICCVGVMYSGE
jgi:hypothetical protein